jgi:cytochrome c oxidase assembly protein subunit 15
MSLAVLQVFILMWAVAKSFYLEKNITPQKVSSLFNILLVISIILSFSQIILGTQVREALDIVAKKMGENMRNTWVTNLGIEFYIHRSFSWLILASHVGLLILSSKILLKNWNNIIKILFLLVVLEFMAGVGLAYLGFPSILQPLHLLLAILIIGIQFIFLLLLNPTWFFKSNLMLKA